MLCVGGESEELVAMVLNTDTRIATAINPPPYPLSVGTAHLYRTKVYILGGMPGSQYFISYDIYNDSWEELPSL
jgi:hypothetical protein